MIGISTSYCSHIYRQPQVIFKVLRDIGYEVFEIDFRWDENMCAQLKEIVKEEKISIASLHNFCPIPEGVDLRLASPETYLLSSRDEEERKLAVKCTKRTIEFAHQLRAKAVILHCGKVFEKKLTSFLIKMYNSNQEGSRAYQNKLTELVALRKKKAKRHFSNALRSLEELDKFAKEKNIKLGIENRYYFGEIPQVEEIKEILDTFDESSSIGYWHDVGHAQSLENIGFYKLEDYLTFFNRLIGIHLHDIKDCCDHLAPFEGEFNFERLIPFVGKESLKIVEAHQPASLKAIAEARIKLEKIFS